ncbi:MAG TPA: nucleotidyltransferase family protein [Dehalococcoidia bacterium]|nr:nucleotidyltransferase family protein [Dehalococcoidia bacterium]
MTVAAIILAAGASRRMGRPKGLLPWGDRSLLAWEVDELMRSSADDIVVVLGHHAEDVRRSLGDGARYCVFNQRWPQGRATSLSKGAKALVAGGRAAPEAIVIQNVDQPTRADIIDRLVAELRSSGAEVVQPSYRGKAGHPVVLSGALIDELIGATEATFGLRSVLERHAAHLVAMDDEPVVRIDLDTPDTLDEGRRLLGVAGVATNG